MNNLNLNFGHDKNDIQGVGSSAGGGRLLGVRGSVELKSINSMGGAGSSGAGNNIANAGGLSN